MFPISLKIIKIAKLKKERKLKIGTVFQALSHIYPFCDGCFLMVKTGAALLLPLLA